MSIPSFEELYEQAPCGLIATDSDGLILIANAAASELTGLRHEQLVGATFASLLEPGSRVFYETRHLPVLRLQGSVNEVALTLRSTAGTATNILVTSSIADGVIETALFDATERIAYERALLDARRLSESATARLGVLQAASVAFAACATEVDVSAALVSSAREAFDASFCAVALLDDEGEFTVTAGHHPDVVLGAPTMELPKARAVRLRTEVTIASPEEADEVFPEIAAGLRAARIQSVSIVPLLDGDRPLGVLACSFLRSRVFDQAFLELQAALARLAAEVLVRLRLQRQLESLAHFDALTGLVNGRVLRDGATELIASARAEASTVAVFFVDLDGFKEVNDELGHRVGDLVLREVAERLAGCVRAEDLVGRIGGDEFVVACPGVDEQRARELGDELCTALRAPYAGVPSRLRVSASIGVAVHNGERDAAVTTDDLLGIADGAMYRAKNAGGDRFTLAPAQN